MAPVIGYSARKGDGPMVIKRFEPLPVGKVAGVLYAAE